jgi:uncharacterized protein (TIGR02145 family)
MRKFTVLLALVISGATIAQNSLMWNGAQWVENQSETKSASSSSVSTVFNPTTGKTWMDRNLGASQVATSSTHVASYGDLYQWGRGADGHQLRTSQTTTQTSGTLKPGHAMFILSSSDWRHKYHPKSEPFVWNGVNGINNPCPSGFRLPTVVEWEAEFATWEPYQHGITLQTQRAYNSVLKLPAAGVRGGSTGQLLWEGQNGYYATSNSSGTLNNFLYFSPGELNFKSGGRASGHSVRCIKD